MTDSIGVAVIGGGMAGRAHAAGYRSATTVFGTDRPDVRLVAIADMNEAVADDTAKRYGYERAEYDWRAIADAPDIDAVSVVVANHLHREIVEGLLAAGKHVLCEKPLAGSLADAEAMVAAAAELRPGHRSRLHLPTLPRRRDDPSRTGRGHAGRTGALQRSLLVRLRAGSDLADHLALQGRSRHRCARRRRQPPAGSVRVRLRTDRRGQRGVVRDDRQEPAGSTRASPTGTPRVRSATNWHRWRTRTSRPSPPRSTTAPSAPSRRPGSRTTCPTALVSSCSHPRVQPPGTCTAPVNSRSPATTSAATSAVRAGY